MITINTKPPKIELKANVSGSTTIKIKPGKHLSAALVALALSIPVSEYLALPLAEKCGLFAGQKAVEHNKQIFYANCMRNWAGAEKPLFKTAFVSIDKSAPSPRILVLGDSFVWGDGYANINDLWWMKLSRALKERGLQCSVIGSGHPGFSIKSQVKVLPSLIEQVKPDYVICQFIPDDADSGLVKGSNQPDWLQKARLRTSKYLPNLSEFLFPKIEQIVAIASKIGSNYDATDNAGNSKDLDQQFLEGESGKQFVKNLRSLKAICDGAKIPLQLVTLPTVPDDKYNTDHFAPVVKIARQNNITILDLSQGFADYCNQLKRKLPLADLNDLKRLQNILRINPANYHPSVALTTFYAKQTAESLIESNIFRNTTKTRKSNLVINDTFPTICTNLRPDKNLKNGESSYFFTYPPRRLLYNISHNKECLLFNFESSQNLIDICIESAGEAEITLECTCEDPNLGFDTEKVKFKETMSGTAINFHPNLKHVNSVRINITKDKSPQTKIEKRIKFIPRL
jgi:hypothetical protein